MEENIDKLVCAGLKVHERLIIEDIDKSLLFCIPFVIIFIYVPSDIFPTQ
jgi:TRAP-type mannitol/chloroaromatic compound transport system permease small subunit